MKQQVKNLLSEFGVWSLVDELRRRPEIDRWIYNGCSGVAPAPVKRRILAAYKRRYKPNMFIETGTHTGDTLAYMAQDRTLTCISIELSGEYYQAAKKRFKNYHNVKLIHGDSAKVLPEVVDGLNESALFWLDGHYSGGKTASGEFETPISAELECILSGKIRDHVILIDDARCFDGTHDYPSIGRLVETVTRASSYSVEISADIMRLTAVHPNTM